MKILICENSLKKKIENKKAENEEFMTQGK